MWKKMNRASATGFHFFFWQLRQSVVVTESVAPPTLSTRLVMPCSNASSVNLACFFIENVLVFVYLISCLRHTLLLFQAQLTKAFAALPCKLSGEAAILCTAARN